ncbi:glutamate receptor ionotropic, delta-2-like [Culicoides brevitarsis]|uniref:glutamate receptor ionotropic, delta-2-like n=1 Tax=Culicoides brevitarsis TaxID=469753 RepID=UPI00307B4574
MPDDAIGDAFFANHTWTMEIFDIASNSNAVIDECRAMNRFAAATNDDSGTLTSVKMKVSAKNAFFGYFPFINRLKQLTLEEISNRKLQNMNSVELILESFESTFSLYSTSNSSVTFEGVDICLAELLSQKLNFSLKTFPRDGEFFGSQLPNGSFSGAIGRISRRETDFAMVGFFIKDYGTPELDFSTPLYSDQLCVVVKKAERIHAVEIPLLIFDTKLWIFCFFVMFLSSGFMFFLRNLNVKRGKVKKKSPFDAPIVALKGFFSISMHDLPIVTNERLFLACLLMFSVIVLSMFQSNLANFYIKPLYYRDIDTLEQLDAQIDQIIVQHRAIMDDAFPDNVSQTMTNLKMKLQLDNLIDDDDLMNSLSHFKRRGCITRRANTFIEEAKYYIREQLHLVDECPRSYNLAFIMPKDSYLNERLNEVLGRIVASGLIQKWTSEMVFNQTMKNLKIFSELQNVNFRTLTLEDLQLSFYVLLAGILMSVIVLIFESCIKSERNE